MSSVWGGKCQKCKQKKAKVILSLKIVLFDISDIVGEYLPCDDCMTYLTLSSQYQKWMFAYVKEVPFPETLDALWDMYYGSLGRNTSLLEATIGKLNETTFEIAKFIYDNIFIDWENEPKLVYTIMDKAHKEMKKRTRGIKKQTVYNYITGNIINIMQFRECITWWRAEYGKVYSIDEIASSHLLWGINKVWCPW